MNAPRPSPETLDILRERWGDGEQLTNAELAALAEAGDDDDALDELHERELDRLGEL